MPSRKQFKTNEEYNKYFREYREKNAEKLREYSKNYNKMRRQKGLDFTAKTWKEKNKLKVQVENRLQRAVKSGKIKKCPCIICQNENSQAHHPDYNIPLKVIWLCQLHHRQLHLGKIKIKGQGSQPIAE